MPCAPAASPHRPVPSPPTSPLRTATALAALAIAVALGGRGSSKVSTGKNAVEKPDLTVAVVPAAGAAGLYIA